MIRQSIALLQRYGHAVARALKRRARLAADYRIVSASGFFDADWYVKIGSPFSRSQAIKHYVLKGGRQGQSPSQHFDSEWYLSTYTDVAEADIDPLVHFLRYGLKEGRKFRPIQKPNVITASADYIAIRQSELFDPVWYLVQNPDLHGLDPVEHYLLHGGREGRAASPRFDSQWYYARYADACASGRNPLLFHLDFGSGRETKLQPDLHKVLMDNITDWSNAESSIRTDARIKEISKLDKAGSVPSAPVYTAWVKIFSSLSGSFDRIIFIPSLENDDNIQAISNISQAATETYGVNTTLVVVTDTGSLEGLACLPPGLTVLALPLAAPQLVQGDLVRLTEVLVFSLRPKSILNINSRICWDLYAIKGKAISAFTQLFAAIFWRDHTQEKVGYADTHLIQTIEALTRLYVDEQTFISDLIAGYNLPNSLSTKLEWLVHPCPTVDVSIETKVNNPRMRVVWAGSLSLKNSIALLERIIHLAPEIDFVVYGSGDENLESNLQLLASQVSNVTLRGRLTGLETLPLSEFDAFLCTSRWEGAAATIVQVAAACLPIVAPGVGGFPEVLNHQTGWRVDDLCNEGTYVACLREVWANRGQALSRAQLFRSLVLNTHSWSHFTASLSGDHSFLGGNN